MYDADHRDRDVTLNRRVVKSLDERTFLWVELPARDSDELTRIGGLLDLPKSTIDALGDEQERARLIRNRDLIHLTVQAIERRGDKLATRAVDLVAGPNWLLTVHNGSIEALDAFAEQIPGDTLLGRLDAGSFLAALVDSVVVTWFDRVEEVERDIDALDEIAMRGPERNEFLVEVLRLRRRIALVRRTIAPHREAIAPLARPDFEIDERLGRPWPGLADRFERALDATENARELLVGSFDLYLGRSAQRANEVMKALTIVSAVLLPSVVLAGIMGMNFKLPFFEETSNFWVVIGAMVAFALSVLVVARLRRWI